MLIGRRRRLEESEMCVHKASREPALPPAATASAPGAPASSGAVADDVDKKSSTLPNSGPHLSSSEKVINSTKTKPKKTKKTRIWDRLTLLRQKEPNNNDVVNDVKSTQASASEHHSTLPTAKKVSVKSADLARSQESLQWSMKSRKGSKTMEKSSVDSLLPPPEAKFAYRPMDGNRPCRDDPNYATLRFCSEWGLADDLGAPNKGRQQVNPTMTSLILDQTQVASNAE